MTDNALNLLKKNYFKENENCWEDVCKRVCTAIVQAEDERDRTDIYKYFYSMMTNMEFIPSSPCLMNAGTQSQQLSSCFIISIDDNIESIYNAKAEMAKIFQKNGGVGFNISALRPANSVVQTSKGYSCGAIGFMEEFNLTADIVTRNNARKGAIKIDMNDWHPDIFDFISCKDDTTKLTRMNISVSASNKFMNAVKNDSDWDLKFPDYESMDKEIYHSEWHGDIDDWEEKGYPVKIYKTIKARELYNAIMEHAWRTGEPGISFRDIMNADNPNPKLGKISSTNPCSEFCSIPYNSCNLGSINLSKFINEDGIFDGERLRDAIYYSVRFLDDMITINQLPLEKIDKVTKSVRSIGLGTMGLADALYMMKITYGDNTSIDVINQLYDFIRKTAKESSTLLAKERGTYPEYKDSVFEEQGVEIRNSNFLSIAPNGSISFIANTSGGLEPNFALVYTRLTNDGTKYHIVNPILEKWLKDNGMYTEEMLNKISDNHGSCLGIKELPQYFVTAQDVTPSEHVSVVAEIQKYVDLAASKTVNLPNDAKVSDIYEVYMKAWEKGIKGLTVYRDGSRENQTLSTENKKEEAPKEEISIEEKLPWGTVIEADDNVIGLKRKLITGCGSLHCTAFFDPVSGELVETYFSKGSSGGCQQFMVGLSRTISLLARAGVDINTIVDQLNSCGTCPSYAIRTATKHDTSKGACCPMAIGNALLDMYKEMHDRLYSKRRR
jgi:ribonucleoside-diphosphate reductase alpha chain